MPVLKACCVEEGLNTLLVTVYSSYVILHFSLILVIGIYFITFRKEGRGITTYVEAEEKPFSPSSKRIMGHTLQDSPRPRVFLTLRWG